MRKFQLHPQWQEVGEKIAREGGVALVLGAVDVGKSTFCAAVAFYALNFYQKVAVVDADIGQSDIGPPGTIGLGFAHPEMMSLSDIPLSALYFVGDISPQGHFLDMVVGTEKMVRKALELGAELVLVDTTGLVSGMPARKLKSFKIEAIRPNHLVALQRGIEVEHILKGWEKTSWLNIYRLPPSPLASARSFEERKENRERKVLSHFANASFLTFTLDRIAFRNSPIFATNPLHPSLLKYLESKWGRKLLWGEGDRWGIWLVGEEKYGGLSPLSLERELGKKVHIITVDELTDRYVGLASENGEYIEVGIIKSIGFAEKNLTIYTPLRDANKVSTIVFGSMKINLPQKKEDKYVQNEDISG
ncbi:hypothetical protein H5T87_00280 [bacterium]|nr:hypothetical protein [bacterium]